MLSIPSEWVEAGKSNTVPGSCRPRNPCGKATQWHGQTHQYSFSCWMLLAARQQDEARLGPAEHARGLGPDGRRVHQPGGRPWLTGQRNHGRPCCWLPLQVCLLTNPLWVVKTRLQLQRGGGLTRKGAPMVDMLPAGAKRYNGFVHAVKCIMKEEGLAGFYKGLGPSLLLVSSASPPCGKHTSQ